MKSASVPPPKLTVHRGTPCLGSVFGKASVEHSWARSRAPTLRAISDPSQGPITKSYHNAQESGHTLACSEHGLGHPCPMLPMWEPFFSSLGFPLSAVLYGSSVLKGESLSGQADEIQQFKALNTDMIICALTGHSGSFLPGLLDPC